MMLTITLKVKAPAGQAIGIEEIGELQEALCKYTDGRDAVEHLAEEIADVQIMLAQMIILHDCANAVEEFKRAKIKRLEDNLRNGN